MALQNDQNQIRLGRQMLDQFSNGLMRCLLKHDVMHLRETDVGQI